MADLTMSRVSSADNKSQSSSIRSKASSISVSIKKRFSSFKEQWGPGLAAKEHWDDEYTFPAGRWAGQGLDPR